MTSPKYTMSIDLNVLNHLGINLYSNVPSVLAEAVANAWDADADKVNVEINPKKKTITITDTGHGMTAADINEKFLKVGYRRREEDTALTPKLNRPVMGRKGIGKLSLFSIADTIEVVSTRKGEKNGFRMSLPEIRTAIKTKSGQYAPVALPPKDLSIVRGTTIVLKDLRKQLHQTEAALRRRLARRFTVIGSAHKFALSVNGKPIKVTDREYFGKLQYMWTYGKEGEACKDHCPSHVKIEKRPKTFFTGWIGTAKEVGQLKDDDGESLNKIVIIVRGKLAQEDVLEAFGEGGMYANYLIGEIHADFLDDDNQEDIATSSRQAIIEDDDRFIALKQAIQKELKHIQNQWSKNRNEDGQKVALEIPAIKTWFSELGKDDRARASKLFGRINQLTLENPEQRSTLFKYGVLAFESLKAKQNLDALENINASDLVQFGEIFGQLDDLEATFFHQIISGRINVVKALHQNVSDNVLEKVIQKHLFDHLWLLDPSWERATATSHMEKTIEGAFDQINKKLTKEERDGRVDIRYQTTSGKHVIIELKRASVQTDTDKLMVQVKKYRNAMHKVLDDMGRGSDPIEIICVVGKPLSDWGGRDGKKVSTNQLKEIDTRVVLYGGLIESAYRAYKDFLDKGNEAGRIYNLLKEIDDSIGI